MCGSGGTGVTAIILLAGLGESDGHQFGGSSQVPEKVPQTASPLGEEDSDNSDGNSSTPMVGPKGHHWGEVAGSRICKPKMPGS